MHDVDIRIGPVVELQRRNALQGQLFVDGLKGSRVVHRTVGIELESHHRSERVFSRAEEGCEGSGQEDEAYDGCCALPEGTGGWSLLHFIDYDGSRMSRISAIQP